VKEFPDTCSWVGFVVCFLSQGLALGLIPFYFIGNFVVENQEIFNSEVWAVNQWIGNSQQVRFIS
jgi:hypothetical protein